MNRALACVIALLAIAAALWAEPLVVRTDRFVAQFSRGALVSLKDAAGTTFVAGAAEDHGATVRRVDHNHPALSEDGPTSLAAAGAVTRTCAELTDLPGGAITTGYGLDPASGDLVITQQARSPQKGVWGVEWSLENVPLDLGLVTPCRSGVRLDRRTPGTVHVLDYPISWEAQLVIVEGEGRGFYVWAEDAEGRYKRLTVQRRREGWRLSFATVNYAPFDDHTACESVRWRLNVYEGDWRVPARRYRDWADEHLRPTPIEDQRPGWVKDIRCCVIMGMHIPTIEALAGRLDPSQTLLYIPSWRKAGYDRDYPVYDEVLPELEPFLERAHELGYRVMLHVNYFGCDPLNPLYERFEPLQVRSPWGNHDKQWWLWERADPIIKFAYINPASKQWRGLFVERMDKLCRDYAVDALHLDQTLCIYNDHNGLIDGQSMLQGNIALHRELREALPDVALSGEGLNEVTYRHEAFAQRHAWGVNHTEGTWSRAPLKLAHPICSYLFRPYTIIYGYLGVAPPTSGQLYAAWNEAYQHWGVIPTLKPSLGEIADPKGFSRQFFDEVAFWQEQRVDPDMDGPWPEGVFFPLRTAAGERAARTADRVLLWGDREISRTLSDVTQVRLPGTVPGWRVYDAERIFGLDPEQWYPYVTDPRDPKAFHVEKLPEGFTAAEVTQRADMAVVRTKQLGVVVADLMNLLEEARTGSRPFDGEPVETTGPLAAADGAGFHAMEAGFFAHPPWKAQRRNPETGVLEAGGTGVTYAVFTLALPAGAGLRFVSEVAMQPGAVGEGKTDGVTYGVTARCEGQELHAELHNAGTEPQALSLDLTPFAGKTITLELTSGPGPARSATYDWGYWGHPRVEKSLAGEGEMVVVSPERWAFALTGTSLQPLEPADDRYFLRCAFPGAVFLTNRLPEEEARLPLDIASARFLTTFVSDTGMILESPQHAAAHPGSATVGGVERSGVFAHPPDHGRTVIDLPLRLPAQAADLHCYVGLRDGSKSDGVIFIVEANGSELAREIMLPGEWREVTCDLSPWAGKPLVLTLTTDADGSHYYDWACWAEPTLRPR